ncbi:MAG: glycosyltransferase, partial [Bacteriovoracaceae bacterium]|nr:glycosyltransferase [Bacteriovoracaceae bacterium]
KDCIQLVKDLGMSDRVHFLQGINNQELPVLYQAAKMFVFPSFFEGFGIPLIEAMFSRIPVLTSFGSCFPEVAGPDSWYLDPYKSDDIERVMSEVLNTEDKEIQKRVERSYVFVQKFHCQNTTSQLVDIYSQLIQH